MKHLAAAFVALASWAFTFAQGAAPAPSGTLFTGLNISLVGLVGAAMYVTGLYWQFRQLQREVRDLKAQRSPWNGLERRRPRRDTDGGVEL